MRNRQLSMDSLISVTVVTLQMGRIICNNHHRKLFNSKLQRLRQQIAGVVQLVQIAMGKYIRLSFFLLNQTHEIRQNKTALIYYASNWLIHERAREQSKSKI